MIRTALALVLTPLLLAAQGREKPAPDLKDVKYGPHERNVIDLWRAKSDKPTPLVIYIHGGGFRQGSKEQVSGALISAALQKGVSVASINYRLSHQAIYPAPMHDSARAVQFLRSKAKEYNLDPARFGATGGSAGAGISLWLAFHDDMADPKAEDPVLRESTRLKAAWTNQGQCSYDPKWIAEKIGGKAHEHPALGQLVGQKPGEAETDEIRKRFEDASPITHLTKDDVAVYMTYNGTDKPSEKAGDGIHSEKFGEHLKAAMEKAGLACEVKVGRGVDEAARTWLLKTLIE